MTPVDMQEYPHYLMPYSPVFPMSKFLTDVEISSFRFFHWGGYSILIGHFEPYVVGVLFVEVIIRLWSQLLWKLLQYCREQGVDRFLFRSVTVPNGDQM